MEIQRSKWWKYYFYLLVAITALGSIEFLINEASGIAEAIYVPLSIIGLIGLYGYVFSRKILHRTFWLYFIAIYLAATIAYYFVTDIDLSADMTPEEYIYVNIFSWAISLPGYIGILLYGLPSNKLWNNDV
jgi:hypothetical protein